MKLRSGTAPSRHLITVGIATHNRPLQCAMLLETLVRQSVPRDKYEVIVVDNGSEPECRTMLKNAAQDAQFRLITLTEAGLSAARNAILAETTTPLIAFLDDDARPDDVWLEAVVHSFDHPLTTIVGGPVRSVFASTGRPQWLTDDLLRYYSHLDYGSSDRWLDSPSEYVVGANMAFRTEALRNAGSFQLRLGRVGSGVLLGDEEVVVQRKIKSEGGRLFYAAKAAVSHTIEPERLTPHWLRARVAWQVVSDRLSDTETESSVTRLSRASAALGLSREVDVLFDAAPDRVAEQISVIRALQLVLLDPFALDQSINTDRT